VYRDESCVHQPPFLGIVEEKAVTVKTSCAVCAAPLDQARTGRPRRYCSPTCRRVAERRILRNQALLLRAEKAAQSAGLKAALGHAVDAPRVVAYWRGEVERLEAELAALLEEPQRAAEPTGGPSRGPDSASTGRYTAGRSLRVPKPGNGGGR
jgi:hypothetical protein